MFFTKFWLEMFQVEQTVLALFWLEMFQVEQKDLALFWLEMFQVEQTVLALFWLEMFKVEQKDLALFWLEMFQVEQTVLALFWSKVLSSPSHNFANGLELRGWAFINYIYAHILYILVRLSCHFFSLLKYSTSLFLLSEWIIYKWSRILAGFIAALLQVFSHNKPIGISSLANGRTTPCFKYSCEYCLQFFSALSADFMGIKMWFYMKI